MNGTRRIGLALSGGGAAGLGHVVVLQALDDLGIRPAAVAGSSMGAILGAAYAAGWSGDAIAAHVRDLAERPGKTLRSFVGEWTEGLGLRIAALESRAALAVALPEGLPERFDQLDLPLTVVATDFHARKPVFLREGSLIDALAASMAIPGVFAAVRHTGRVLVDGGVSDNLPVAALDGMDVILAVDTATPPETDSDELPTGLALVAGAMRIMMKTLRDARMARDPRVRLLQPDARRYGMLEFHRALEILDEGDETRPAMCAAIEKALEEPAAT